MVYMEIEVSLRWSIMALHADVYEYDQWIKQARGIITLIVASITNPAQEHIQPTDCIKNCSQSSELLHIYFTLLPH